MPMISLQVLNSADKRNFVAELGAIYENAPWVAEAAFERRPFASLGELHEAMTETIRHAAPELRSALIKGHPDLAGRAARAGAMTEHSKAEQASVGLDRISESELKEFHRLNTAYREKFGFPFIICVRRHGKDSILRQFERRLHNSVAAEAKAALTEVFRIAALRLDQKVEAPDRLKVQGHLSTHVLDTYFGHPGAGVIIELMELSLHGEPHSIVRTVTNLDGRSDQPLIYGRPIPIGRYELRFHVGAYFARRGVTQADPPFLDVVPVQFAIAEPEGHYHVPLLVTPWSYTTYRGS